MFTGTSLTPCSRSSYCEITEWQETHYWCMAPLISYYFFPCKKSQKDFWQCTQLAASLPTSCCCSSGPAAGLFVLVLAGANLLASRWDFLGKCSRCMLLFVIVSLNVLTCMLSWMRIWWNRLSNRFEWESLHVMCFFLVWEQTRAVWCQMGEEKIA